MQQPIYRRALIVLLALCGGAALAADNATLITPCGSGCVTVRAKDVGLGVQSPVYILGDTSGNPIYGTAGTANANILTVQGIASMTPLLVNGSGVTQPVSGTVTANQGGAPWSVSQSGTWTVQQGTPPWTIQGDSASGASNAGNPVKGGGVFNTTQPTVTTGQTVDAQYTARGAAIVATGVDAFTVAGSGTFTVAGTVTSNQGTSPWVDNITQFGGVALSTGTGASGTGIPRVTVSNDSNILATQSGTWTVQQGTPPWQQVGNVASASADSGNPVKVGCVAHTVLPTAGSDGNRFDCMADKFGRLAVVMNGDRALATTGTVTVSSTTETTLLASVASTFLDVTHLSCTNNSATLVRIDIRDATAGTIRFSRALAASGGGFVDDFNMPFPQSAAGNNWTVQLSAAVTDVRCDILAMKNK